MAEFITVSAKTVEEAVTEASIKLGVVSDHVEYEVVEKGSSGVFGFGSKPAVIRAWQKEEADIALDFHNTCALFCVVNPATNHVISFSGVGAGEAYLLQKFLDYLKTYNW